VARHSGAPKGRRETGARQLEIYFKSDSAFAKKRLRA